MERKQWLATRKTGIGGSDAAAILGLSPWKSPMDVWLDKKGLTPERHDPDKDFMFDLGQRMEPVIAGLYERDTGRRLVTVPLFRHPLHPILLGSPDRLVLNEKRGVELKTENQFADQFGDPGTDEVPQHYYLQCAHYMMVLDFPVWDVAVLHGGMRFSLYTIHRDKEVEEMMMEQLLTWWDRHIVKDVPPALDSSNAWRTYLHQKHPVEIYPVMSLAGDEAKLTMQNIERLARIHRVQDVIEAMRAEIESQLKYVIADSAGLTSPVGKVTWKKTKDGSTTDWRLVAELIATHYGTHPDMFAEFVKSNTQPKPGVRRFLFTPPKEESNGNFVEIGNAVLAAAGRPALPPGDSEHGAGSASESTD